MRTLRMVALYDTVPLGNLVDQLDELELRPREAWSPRASVQHQAVERAVVDRILAKAAPAGVAVECALDLEVRSHGREVRALLSALEPGGARIELDAEWSAGTALQLVTASTRIAVTVSGRVGDSLRVMFLQPRTASAEMRIHAFLREALAARSVRRVGRRVGGAGAP